MSSAAYVLLESLRRLGLQGSELARAQAGTIHSKLLKIGVRITCSVRRVVLYLASSYPFKALLEGALRRLREPHLHPS
jgi:hypothetical protein